MSRAARGSGLNLAGAAVSAVSNFALTVAVTRGVPKDIAGILFTASSIFLLASAVGRLGTDTGLVYFISRARADSAPHKVRSYLGAALRPVLVSAGITVVLLVLAAPFLGRTISRPHAGLVTSFLLVLAVLIPFAAIENVALSATRGLGTMRPNTIVEQVFRPLLQLLMVVVVVRLGNRELLAVAWGFCYAPAALFAWMWLRRRLAALTVTTPDDTRRGREFWGFTGPRSLASIVQLAMQRLDIVLVALIAGPASAAVYTAATRFVVVGQMGRNAVSLAVQPDMAQSLHRGDVDETNALYRATTAWLMLATWPVYLLLTVNGSVLLRLFGHGYGAGATVLLLISAAMLVATLCGDVDIVLIMAGRTSWSLVNVSIAFAINLVLDLVLIPHLGILGAAIGWSVAILAKNLSALVQIAIVLKLHPFGRATTTAALLCLVCFAMVPLGMRALWGDRLATGVAAMAIGAMLFLIGALLLRKPLLLDAFLARRHEDRH